MLNFCDNKACLKIGINKYESSIGAVNVCNECIVQIELLKIVLQWIGVDFTYIKDDIFFEQRKLEFFEK